MSIVTIIVAMTFILKVISYHYELSIGPVKLFSVEMWVAVVSFIVLLMYPGIFIKRAMLWTIIYGVVISVMDLSGHLVFSASDWLKAQVIPLFLCVLLSQVYQRHIPYKKIYNVVIAILLMILISIILNINGLTNHPGAVRFITGGGISDVVYNLYRKAGIEGYGFFSGLPPLIPALVYLYKSSQRRLIKLSALIFISLLFISIVLSSITTPLILASIALVLSMIGSSVFRRGYSIILMLILFLAVIIFSPEQMGSALVKGLISISPSEEVDLRLADIDKVISGEFEVTETSERLTSVEARFQRVYWNLGVFSKYPIIGSSRENEKGAFHLFWLYMLATIGLLGTLPLIVALYLVVSDTYRRVGPDFRYYYMMSFILFFLMGAVKNIAGWFMYFVPLFLVPGIYWASKALIDKRQPGVTLEAPVS